MDLEGKDFHHPYTPYDIQLQFMRALYDCIEHGKIGIFESPTGNYHDTPDIYPSIEFDLGFRYCRWHLSSAFTASRRRPLFLN
jgi:hypothetical protein